MTSVHGRPLKVGLILHISEYPEDDALGQPTRARRPDRWTDLVSLARQAEAVGFDSIMLPDHLLYRRAGQPTEGAWECFSTLAALSASTDRLELGTIVASTQFRHPGLLAKQATTLDEISGGRLILGLGAGWHEPELDAFGYPIDHPVGRFEEALQVIVGLLKQETVSFTGAYYTIQNGVVRPHGPRPQGPPLLLGSLGLGPRMLRLTVMYADLWKGIVDATETERFTAYAQLHERIDRACWAAGRDPATLGRTFCEYVNPLNRPEYVLTSRGPALSGSVAQIADAMQRYARAGVSQLFVEPLPISLAGVEAMAPVLDLLDRN